LPCQRRRVLRRLGRASTTGVWDALWGVRSAGGRGGTWPSRLPTSQDKPGRTAGGEGRSVTQCFINTSSHSAVDGDPGFAPYEIAKGAIHALTRNALQEWAKYGIVSNVFLPIIRTPAYDLSEQGRAIGVDGGRRLIV
jgi:NAD(P)-dependent dehydrogenase (short-subunit alcohol dehydrogenase family)